MRRLLLLRHAKSSRPPGIEDLDRPLARRGREAMRRMGDYLAEEGLHPDLALVSPARRTEETWKLARESLGNVPTRSEPRIYEAPPHRLLSVIQEVEPDVQSLLMVGHNPGFEEFLSLLVRYEDRFSHAGAITKFPTAALAVIDVPAAGWHDVAPLSGHLDRFVTPRSLGLPADE